MAKYEAACSFTDLQDKNKVYKKGDPYPAPSNKKISDKRLKELLSTDNKLGKSAIVEVKESKKTKEQE